MAGRTINLELLLSRQVFAVNGRAVGRIEEIRAEADGDDLVVMEYHLGAPAVLERLSASHIGAAILDVFSLRKQKGYRVPWDKLDLSDPQHPRLTCKVGELDRLEKGSDSEPISGTPTGRS
jgi:sporulation protein YlmC with PRC-barrel domain